MIIFMFVFWYSQCNASVMLYIKSFPPTSQLVTTKFHLSDDRSWTFSWQVEISNPSRGCRWNRKKSSRMLLGRWIWLMIQWCFIASSFGNPSLIGPANPICSCVHAGCASSPGKDGEPNQSASKIAHFTTSQAAKLIENNPKEAWFLIMMVAASKRRRALLRRDSNSSCAWRLHPSGVVEKSHCEGSFPEICLEYEGSQNMSQPDEFCWNLQISHWDRSTSQSNHMNTNDPSWFFRVNLIIWRRQPENIKPFSQNPNKIGTRSLPIKKNSTWVNLIGFHIEKTCGSSGFIVHHVPFSVQTDQQPMAWEDLSLSSSKARPKRKGPNLQRLRGSHLSRNQDSKASNKLPVMSPQEFGLQIHCPGDKNGRVFFQEKKACMKKKMFANAPNAQPSVTPIPLDDV